MSNKQNDHYNETVTEGKNEVPNAGRLCKCGHAFWQHYDRGMECGKDVSSGMADGLYNYCLHCEKEGPWKENPPQGIEEKELSFKDWP